MIHRWPRLALLLGVGLFVCVGAATAQTVIVKGATSGTPIELVVNGANAATATADAEGLATLTAPQSGAVPATQTRMSLFVDRCGNLRRIFLIDAAAGAPPAAGCVRDAVNWRFMVGRVSTFVIDISGTVPTVRLTQGEAPKTWLLKDVPGAGETPWGPTPSGLIAFGGGGLGALTGLATVACGDTSCSSTKPTHGVLSAGVQYWVVPMLAAEVQYINPAAAKAQGSDTSYSFNSALSARVLTVSGLVGAPLGRARIYARAGMNRHGVNLTTTQVNNERSVTVDGVAQTIPGHTQTFEVRAENWGPVLGGGGEGWISQRIGIYGDLTRAWLSGDAVDEPEGHISSAGWFVQTGVRFRIGGLGGGAGAR